MGKIDKLNQNYEENVKTSNEQKLKVVALESKREMERVAQREEKRVTEVERIERINNKRAEIKRKIEMRKLVREIVKLAEERMCKQIGNKGNECQMDKVDNKREADENKECYKKENDITEGSSEGLKVGKDVGWICDPLSTGHENLSRGVHSPGKGG